MIHEYRSPLPVFQLLNNRIAIIGVGRLDCLLTYGSKVEVGNKPGRFRRVRAEEDVTNTNIPMIDPKAAESPKTLGRCERLVHRRAGPHTFCGALSCIQ